MADKPQATPWGELIRVAREAHVPKLSVAAAARLTHDSVSKENWGHVERGYQPHRGGYRAAPGNAGTVAHMARVVGLTPDRLAQAGRSDAAEILREMTRDESDRPRYTDPTEQYIANTPGADEELIRGMIGIKRMLEAQRGQGSRSA